jgi:NAD(P)-dependent dehydrogenase (short-subunit alcohol dehydrogenase family)
VTGAGRGIGRAIAIELAEHGFDVVMASIEEQAADPPRRRAGSLHYERFDVADLDGHGALIERAVQRFGPLSCLVNNAGVTSLRRGDMLELTPESFDRCVAINLRGTFFFTQAAARHMLQAAAPRDQYRSIVTISSANAEMVGENRPDYCITKAGLAMMSKLFASRLAEAGIGVFDIRPGIIATDMTAPAKARYDPLIRDGGVPMRRWGEPEDVARVVAACARGDLPFTTGVHIDVGGGLQLHRL